MHAQIVALADCTACTICEYGCPTCHKIRKQEMRCHDDLGEVSLIPGPLLCSSGRFLRPSPEETMEDIRASQDLCISGLPGSLCQAIGSGNYCCRHNREVRFPHESAPESRFIGPASLQLDIGFAYKTFRNGCCSTMHLRHLSSPVAYFTCS